MDTNVVFQETGKWSGITAACETVLAAPSHADKEEGRGADTDVVLEGTGKWSGIIAAGGTAVAAPSHANKRFATDIETEEVRGVDTNVVFKGMGKWYGITAAGGNVLAQAHARRTEVHDEAALPSVPCDQRGNEQQQHHLF